MKRQEYVGELNKIYSRVESLEDEYLSDINRVIKTLADDFGGLIQQLEDEALEEEEKENESNS